MRRAPMRLSVLALLIFAQLTTPGRADSTTDEIAYLLKVIRESPCTFIRNGTDYDARGSEIRAFQK
jgi:hypothetical protein